MAQQVAMLKEELHRVQTLLYDMRSQKDRLQYEIDTIHHKHGTYQIICHLRNEIQRLTISKLLLIQSTALEMDRLRKIIHALSRGDKLDNLNLHNFNPPPNNHFLNDLLPPQTPTSPPPNFSWKDTFNIDLNEEHEDNDAAQADNNKLDHEDDIKIPEMKLDFEEDGAIKPISLLPDNNEYDDDDDDDDKESNDDDEEYVIERVASADIQTDSSEHDPFDENDNDNNAQIAVAEKRTLFSEIANSDDTNTSDSDMENELHDDDNCNHHILQHDASPQLQFAVYLFLCNLCVNIYLNIL